MLVFLYNLCTARTRKYCKKKRELKSSQNQLFEEIFDVYPKK